MATTIVTKSGSGAPTASDLVAGELAVDLTNGRLYTEDSGGTVLELGLNPSGNVDVTGTVTADGLTVDGSADINGDLEVGSAGAGTKAIVIAGSGSSTSVMDLKMFGGGTGNPTSILRHSSATKDFSILTGNSGAELTRLLVTEGGDLSLYEDTGTTPKFFWDASAESLGIGTSSFTSTASGRTVLEVNGSSTSALINLSVNGTRQGYIFTDTTDMNVYNVDSGSLNFGTNNTERMRIDSSGTLFQGTTSPTLHSSVTGTVFTNGSLLTEAARGADKSLTLAQNVAIDAGNTWTYLSTDEASYYQQYGGNHYFATAASGTAGAGAALATKMTILNNGSVGIGTATITSGFKLEVTGDARFGDAVGDDAVEIGWSSGGAQGFIQAYDRGASAFRPLNINNSLTVDASGNVGIGTDSLSQKLHVAGNIVLDASGFVGFGGGTNYIEGSATNLLKFGTANVERMRIDASGNLLVGTTSATGSGASSGKQVIQFNGATENGIYFDDTRTASGTSVAAIFGRGSTAVGRLDTTLTSVALTSLSDERVKTNIVDAPSASDDIDAIQVRSFDWKADGSHQKYGMVAQELQTVAPEAVSAPEDPEDMMGVDYSKLVPMMLKEIQSLRARVAALES